MKKFETFQTPSVLVFTTANFQILHMFFERFSACFEHFCSLLRIFARFCAFFVLILFGNFLGSMFCLCLFF